MASPRASEYNAWAEVVTNSPTPPPYTTPRKPVPQSSSRASVRSTPTRRDGAAYETNVMGTSNAHDRLIQTNSAKSPEQERYVKWGVFWTTPLVMALWALVGSNFAIGHHIYYRSLDGTTVGSSSRQNWAVQFGTAISFLVVVSLKGACDAAYKQYIWTLFKRKTFSLSTLDKLFAVTHDPTAFLSWEFLKHAKVAFFVAATTWCITLAGIAPPATLSVVPGFQNVTTPVSMALLNWNSTNFFDRENYIVRPNSEVLRVATLAAESVAVIPPQVPYPNSSFHLQFFGPSMQCSPANSSQQPNFDYFSQALANSSYTILTKSQFKSGNLKWNWVGVPSIIAPLMSVYSAFSPYSGGKGWLMGEIRSDELYKPDEFNNWVIPLPPDTLHGTSPGAIFGYIDGTAIQQLWIQSADKDLVCTMGNASFDVGYEFVNGAQTLAEYRISMFEPFVVPLHSGDDGKSPTVKTSSINSYMAIYVAFSSLLNGNVSTTLTQPPNGLSLSVENFDGNVSLYDSSSKILQNGLSACDKFVHGYWNGDNAIGIGPDGPVPWRQASSSTESKQTPNSTLSVVGPILFTNISNNLFTKPDWMCRNRTLLKGIEDLANNITMSMLSSPALLKQNATMVNVLHSISENKYKYDSRNLIISYCIAIFFTVLCTCVGFFALHSNGVAHSTAFSTIVATTRNHELDVVSKGHSLGALPLGHTSMRVRFGELINYKGRPWDDKGEGRETGRHIGFGAAENVLSLKKGGKYV